MHFKSDCIKTLVDSYMDIFVSDETRLGTSVTQT